MRPGVTKAEIERRIADGTVVEALVAVPAVVGECHNLPSGTCHALGAGVLVAEVQTPSDTTFRVYDWGRAGRALHIGPALACMDLGPAPEATRVAIGQRAARLVKTEFFNVDGCELSVGESEPAGVGAGCSVLMVVGGEGQLVGPGAAREVLPLGTTVLVPAAVAARWSFKATARARLLRVTLGA